MHINTRDSTAIRLRCYTLYIYVYVHIIYTRYIYM